MPKLRNIVKALLPHGYMLARKKNTFVREYLHWKESGDVVTFDKECRFKTFVSVDGFGCSGSSAVMDLLREYENCTVWASKPIFTSTKENFRSLGEMDLVRHPGGLLYLEHFIKHDYCYYHDTWGDAALKAFASMVFYSDIYQHFPETHRLFFHFFDNLIYQRLPSKVDLVNWYLNPFGNITDMFSMKMMTLSEYHNLCRGLLYSLFNLIFDDYKGDILIIDHIFGDCGYDMKHFNCILPGTKKIVVARDIRAVYVHANQKKLAWIAHDSVEEFLKWEKRMYLGHDFNDTSYLSLYFEDLVKDYDKQVERIEKYLGLSPKQHVRSKEIFNPRISKKNISQWCSYSEHQEDCKRIRELAPILCFKPT